VSTTLVAAVAVWLPSSPIGSSLGFVPLPPPYWPLLAGIVLAYLGVTQLVKALLLTRWKPRGQAGSGSLFSGRPST
jgi:Mg2+-importing ATPase